MENIRVIEEREILGKQFRIYGSIEDPLFLAKDVAMWIEHSDVSTMIRKIDDDEKLIQTMFVSGQTREMWFLTEDGLYEVLMQSRKPIAKEFKKKVKAILKEFRKTGSYIPDNQQAELNAVEKVIRKVQDPEVLDLISTLASGQKQLMEERDGLQEILEINKPKIEFASNVEEINEVFSIGKLAEVMSKHGVMIGRNRLMDWMREMGFLCKQKGVEYNRPKQRMIEQGYMVVSIYQSEDGFGNKIVNNTPLVTGKGIVYFFNKYREYWNSII